MVILLIMGIVIFITITYALITFSKFRRVSIPQEYYDGIFHEPSGKIIISLSTTPSRIKRLENVLSNLEKQTLRPDIVYINIPYWSIREKIAYIVPTLITSLNIKINRCEDFGPLTKLLPTAQDKHGIDDIIITIDDDQEYDKNFIKNMVNAMAFFPESCITFGGWNYFKFFGSVFELYCFPNCYTDILQGYKGAGYRPRFFSKDFFESSRKFEDCFTTDDVYISLHLKKHNIPIIKVKYDKNFGSPLAKSLNAENPLGQLHNGGRRKCIRCLEKYTSI